MQIGSNLSLQSSTSLSEYWEDKRLEVSFEFAFAFTQFRFEMHAQILGLSLLNLFINKNDICSLNVTFVTQKCIKSLR